MPKTCRILTAALVALFFLALSTEAGTTVFTNVNVISMNAEQGNYKAERVIENQSVVVTDGKISRIAGADEAAIPKGAVIIDASGGYLMPGLADMYTHLRYDDDAAHLWLYLNAGVTTIRNMSGKPADLALKESVAKGETPGPNIYTSGPSISGVPMHQVSKLKVMRGALIVVPLLIGLLLWTVLKSLFPEKPYFLINAQMALKFAALIWTAAGLFGYIPVGMALKLHQPDLFIVDNYWHAAAETSKQMEKPYDLVNVRDHLTLAAYEGLINAAREKGRYVGGSLPDSVDLEKALSSGLNEVATLGEYLSYFQKDYDPLKESSGPVAYEIDYSGIQTAVKLTAENGVAVGTGLVADERAQKILEDASALFSGAEYGLVCPEIFESWRERGLALEDLNDKGKYLRQEVRPFAMELAKSLHEAGVTLVAGTSVLDVGVVPGVHMHRELELLVEAGLSPFDALSTATRNAAKIAGKMNGDNKWGTIAEGMRADLALLSANPLEDIKNIRTIKGVMVRGRWYGLTELEKGLEDYKKSFDKIN